MSEIYTNENGSNKANRSNRNDEGEDKGEKRPPYEYLEHTNTYRCNWCKSIFHDQTKDNNASHPCNFRTMKQVWGMVWI